MILVLVGLAECIFVDDILGIFEFVYCIFFWPMMKEKFDMISIFSF